MEPPRVYQPVRQCLGFVLLQANELAKAQEVRFPPPPLNAATVRPLKNLISTPSAECQHDLTLNSPEKQPGKVGEVQIMECSILLPAFKILQSIFFIVLFWIIFYICLYAAASQLDLSNCVHFRFS
jgi:hypothetical protein